MIRFIAVMISFAVLSSCAEMTHLTRTRSMGSSITDSSTNATGRQQAFFIDAKQRAIFQRGAVTCAEPSPDALSAIAASQGLSVATPDGTSIGQSLSIAEAAGAIGLRTQSIQLMRDHMYRVCEAYSGGALPALTFALLHRRFQTTMVGILAIEQLTGVARAPTVVLGGSSRVGDAQAVAQLTTLRETTATSVAEAQTAYKTAQSSETSAIGELTAATAAATAAPGDATAQATMADKKTKADKAIADALLADGTLAGRKAALASIDQQLALARASTSATATGAFEAVQTSRSGDFAAVATAVTTIVNSTMNLTNRDDFCIMLLAETAAVTPQVNPNSPVAKSCLSLLNSNQAGIRQP